jgi:ankyrin repeat protein
MLNNEDAVYLLTRYGADTQAKDADGRTPLDLAKERNASPDLIKRLQEAATESAQPAAAR